MKPITSEQKRQLRAQAHKLKPLVQLGQHGLTEAVHRQVDQVLFDHQLVKIRLVGEDKEQRKQLAEEICSHNEANLVQSIGHVITIYRPRSASEKK